MNQKGMAIRATVYIQADEAEKVRAYARKAYVSDRRALRFLITAGLNYLADKETISERLALLHRESRVRDRELLAMLVEVVLGVRFLVEHSSKGTEKQLREKSKEAMVLLNSKIERNEREWTGQLFVDGSVAIIDGNDRGDYERQSAVHG